MSRSLFWRKALAVPAAIALALGGLALGATPATAAPVELVITSPTNEETVESRTVTVSGSVTAGASVRVYAADGTSVLGSTDAGGELGQAVPFSVTLPEYPVDAPTPQTIIVGGIHDGNDLPAQTVMFSLPAVEAADELPAPTPSEELIDDAGAAEQSVSSPLPAAAPVLLPAPVITSPADGEVITGSQVTFSGTGEPGAFIGLIALPTALVEEALPQQRMAAEEPVPANPADPIPVDEEGTWTVTLPLLPEAYTAIAVQSENADGTGEISEPSEPVSFTVVATLSAPVITSPVEGETITGVQVTFTGTGEPGAYIGLIALPTALIEEALPQQRMAAAEPVPANPADPIPVDENGNWTVTLALLPEAYTAIAIQSENAEGTGNISAPSEPVSFTLAAFVPAPAGSNSGSGANALAETGGTDMTLLAGLATLTLAVGISALAIGTRRRATA